MDLKERIEALTPDQLEKARNLTTPEEVLEFAKSEGIEITDEELEAISGGGRSADARRRWTGNSKPRMS